MGEVYELPDSQLKVPQKFSSLTKLADRRVRVRSWMAGLLIAGVAGISGAQSTLLAGDNAIPLAPQVRSTNYQSLGNSFLPPKAENFFPKEFSGHAQYWELELPKAISPAAALRGSSGFEHELYRESSSTTGYKASSYVPLDSWIYASFDRLAAMGYIPTSSATMRPWSRLECARLLAEAHESIDEIDETTGPLLAALDMEFVQETHIIDGAPNRGSQVESVYGRYTRIAGTPLRDSYHFGQTLEDDYGRPYGQGSNGIIGVSGRSEAGPLAFYFRGEYQYAGAIPVYSTAAQQAISAEDQLPFGWNIRSGTTSRVRPVEAYAALNLANWQISFGQQSLWWGPDRTTSLILSNNAEAMPMLRVARAKPFKMPSFLGWLGPGHFDAFLSRQGGIHYVGLGANFIIHGNPNQALTPPPYLWGATLSFKPTDNLEVGFAHTVIFAGYGRPLTFGTFFHTFSVLGNGQDVDPGKRATEFNFTYHPPGLRKSVVLYTEEFAWDDPIEGKFVARYAMDPGIYIPKLPVLKKMDLRAEGVYTNLPKLPYQAYFYDNAHYPQGYTNYGQILGSWVGRQGQGGQASSTYWFSARNKATVSYRKMTVDKSLLQGGNLSDISGSLTWLIKPQIELSAMTQYEHWKFPLLGTGATSNFSTTFEFRFFPKPRWGTQ